MTEKHSDNSYTLSHSKTHKNGAKHLTNNNAPNTIFATSNKQQATSNKQQATSNKQQATSNKQHKGSLCPSKFLIKYIPFFSHCTHRTGVLSLCVFLFLPQKEDWLKLAVQMTPARCHRRKQTRAPYGNHPGRHGGGRLLHRSAHQIYRRRQAP